VLRTKVRKFINAMHSQAATAETVRHDVRTNAADKRWPEFQSRVQNVSAEMQIETQLLDAKHALHAAR
jgi:hypothetical protein